MILILASLVVGVLSGLFVLPEGLVGNLDGIATIALNFIIILVGIDVGGNKDFIKDLKEKGLKLLLIPLGVIVGSIIGGIVTGLIIKLPTNESLSVATGFGWYSLTGILLAKLGSPELGAIAFLTNVFREVIAIVLLPVLPRFLNRYAALAPAGATSMDSTLPLISKVLGSDFTVIAFLNGAVLSALVPVIVTFFYNL